jgi:hypothetical protein
MRLILMIVACFCLVNSTGCGGTNTGIDVKTLTEEQKKKAQAEEQKAAEEESQGSINKNKKTK